MLQLCLAIAAPSFPCNFRTHAHVSNAVSSLRPRSKQFCSRVAGSNAKAGDSDARCPANGSPCKSLKRQELGSCQQLTIQGTRKALTWVLAAAFCFDACQGPQLLEDWEFAAPLDWVVGVGVADAAGLLQMPPFKLNNRYYLVRSGESEFEKKGIINTNPVAKTSVDSGLSEEGLKQTSKAALELKAMGACEGSCWIWPSITQRSYQAAEIIAYVNTINHSHIVPEYSFLDARGLGAYEGKELNFINEVYTTDSESPNMRPPPFTDGTPNESVADVFVRVTQLMSILETQYSGESIIIVAPDSDNLSVLQAALIGMDLRRHSNLAFAPGEVRYVDIGSVPAPRLPVSGLIKCNKPPICS